MADFPILRMRGLEAAPGALRHDAWLGPVAAPADAAEGRRCRIWDLSASLHCSIIGTCLTATELRRLFLKLGDADARTATDHALHSRGVHMACQRTPAAKLLHKTLDKRHAGAIRRFGKARTIEEVAVLWRDAFDQGDIPGPYWAVLTSPLTDRILMQEAFGDVHMLSHMVGSANRLDLARLHAAERVLAERDDSIARQQARLQASAREREGLLRRIETLEGAAALAGRAARPPDPDLADREALCRKLDAERAHAASLAARLRAAEEAMREMSSALDAAEVRANGLAAELAACERALTVGTEGVEGEPILDGRTLLYVGGRPGPIERLRAIAVRRGGAFLVHDGGVEHSLALLPGLVGQADVALFPVDCVSHRAAERVKALCRDTGKRFVPLRTASVASFVAALRELESAPMAGPDR